MFVEIVLLFMSQLVLSSVFLIDAWDLVNL